MRLLASIAAPISSSQPDWNANEAGLGGESAAAGSSRAARQTENMAPDPAAKSADAQAPAKTIGEASNSSVGKW